MDRGQKHLNQDRWRRWLPVLTALLILVSIIFVVTELRRFTLNDVESSFRRLRAGRLALACLFATASYLTLTGFDWIGVRYVGRTIDYPRIALTSFVALSVGHTIGFAPLSSGAVRYRFYSQWNFSAVDVAKIIALSAVTVGLGETALASVLLLVSPQVATKLFATPAHVVRLLGAIGFVGVIGYVGLCAAGRQFRLRHWSFTPPSWRLALLQILLGIIDFAFVAATLGETFGANAPPYTVVAASYLIANLAALISNTPGGLGVIESVVVLLLPNADAIGPVIAFRVIYFLGPFVIGVALFLVSEIRFRFWTRQATGTPERSTQ